MGEVTRGASASVGLELLLHASIVVGSNSPLKKQGIPVLKLLRSKLDKENHGFRWAPLVPMHQ